MRAEYKYQIHEDIYTISASLGDYRNEVKKGGKYLVKIPEDHPDDGLILFEYPVPDSVVAPEEGWNELPAFAYWALCCKESGIDLFIKRIAEGSEDYISEDYPWVSHLFVTQKRYLY